MQRRRRERKKKKTKLFNNNIFYYIIDDQFISVYTLWHLLLIPGTSEFHFQQYSLQQQNHKLKSSTLQSSTTRRLSKNMTFINNTFFLYVPVGPIKLKKEAQSFTFISKLTMLPIHSLTNKVQDSMDNRFVYVQ